MFVVPLLLLENRTQKENFELSWFLLLLCPAGLCTTVHVTTSMRENPDIGLGHHTARWPLLKTNSFLRPSLTTTSPVFVQSADVSRFSPNPTLIPWSRDPKAGRAPFQTSRCLGRWPGWLARCPSRLLALLHPLLELYPPHPQESRPIGNHFRATLIDLLFQHQVGKIENEHTRK